MKLTKQILKYLNYDNGDYRVLDYTFNANTIYVRVQYWGFEQTKEIFVENFINYLLKQL